MEDLPPSSDEYWEGAEKHVSEKTEAVKICDTHSKDKWVDHLGYVDNHDGTVSCKFCPWGFRLPGYMRVHEGKIVDLRSS